MNQPATKSGMPLFWKLRKKPSFTTRVGDDWLYGVMWVLAVVLVVVLGLLIRKTQNEAKRNAITTKMFVEFLEDPRDTKKYDHVMKALESGRVDNKSLTQALIVHIHQKELDH